jgi:L-alanine-DL-glutamate epimerase-like enolase superfamily enzyme
MNLITKIQITHHQLLLEPPFRASWDSKPRTTFPATIVRVFDNKGNVGIGSGTAMYGFEAYQQHFLKKDALDFERHNALLRNIEFHAGRCYPLDVALWDLAGKIQEKPVWKLLGATSNRVQVYASSGVQRSISEMVEVAKDVMVLGYPAFKIRFGRFKIETDLAVVAAIREAVGMKLELLVDCNQAWRMPWDTGQPWDLERAIWVAQELEKYSVYWVENPLHRGDYRGYSELRKNVDIRVAGGAMTREPYEFRELLERECLDVFQPDCVTSLGIGGSHKLALEVQKHGKIFTPHTWGNGIGLMANLHLSAGTVGAPFVEYPFDPPDWSLARRDFMLKRPIKADAGGWITLSDAPGLGLELNEAMLERTLTAQTIFS